MSSAPIYGTSDPLSYAYKSSATPASASSSPASSNSSASSGTSKQSPYLSELQNLAVYDASELVQVSFGSPQDALNNVIGVLAQATSLDQGLTTATAPAANGSASNGKSTATNPLAIPTLEQIQGQSYDSANTALSNYANAPAGSSIIDYQA